MQDRLAHQRHQFLEQIHTSALGRVEYGRQSGIGVGAPLRAEAAHDFAMDDRWPQRTLTGIVIGRHIRPLQEDEEMRPMRAIAVEQIRPRSGEGTLEQALQPTFQKCDLPPKAGGGQCVAAMTEMDGRAEQGLHLACPLQAGPPIPQALQGRI